MRDKVLTAKDITIRDITAIVKIIENDVENGVTDHSLRISDLFKVAENFNKMKTAEKLVSELEIKMNTEKLTAQNFIMDFVESADGKESLGAVFNCIGNDLFEVMELYTNNKLEEYKSKQL